MLSIIATSALAFTFVSFPIPVNEVAIVDTWFSTDRTQFSSEKYTKFINLPLILNKKSKGVIKRDRCPTHPESGAQNWHRGGKWEKERKARNFNAQIFFA